MTHIDTDILILGGGAAGLAAALYGARGGAKTVLLESAIAGGRLNFVGSVGNYPGFSGATGAELAETMATQARQAGCELVELAEIESLELAASPKRVSTMEGDTYAARAVILAMGSSPKKLGVPGEDEFVGKGVSYCAICDGAFFRGQDAIVVGSGNAAVDEGEHLAHTAKSVTLLHRGAVPKAEAALRHKAEANPGLTFRSNSEIIRILGSDDGVTGAEIRDTDNGSISTLEAQGIFVYVGQTPNTTMLSGQLKQSQSGHLETSEDLRTSLTGVYAAGSCRDGAFKTAFGAAAEGARAAWQALSEL